MKQDILNGINLSNIEVLGIVPNISFIEHYSNASVFVLPSLEEGLAMVMGEAAAYGLPVVATTNAGSDLFCDGVEGFIVPIRSPNVIANKLQQLPINLSFVKKW